MVKELMNKKIFKFSSVTTISSLNICASDWNISKGSIIIENDYCNLQSFNINNTTYKAPCKDDRYNYNNLCNYLSGLFNFPDNGKKLKDSFGDFNNYILTWVNKCDLRTYYLRKFNFDALSDFDQFWVLHVRLIKKPRVRIVYDSFKYRYKFVFFKKIESINKGIVNLNNLTIGDFKKKLTSNGISLDKFNIGYLEYSNEVDDNVDFVTNPVILKPKGDCSDYFEPCKTEIEFIAGNGLELDDKYKNGDEIVFVKENIIPNTNIKNYIFKKYNGLNNSNCTIEYKDKRDCPNYGPCGDNFVFYDGQNLKITINAEISGFTKKKVEKCKINVNFEVKDLSKYVFKTPITNISSLEIEKGKDFNFLKGEIKKHLGKELKSGFVIYKNTKEESNKFTAGPLDDKTTYIVVFDETATDFVKKKDKNKLYIKLKFDVADNSNFKLKQGINDINSITVEQGKNYNELLNIIKGKLGGKDLKEGFKIYKNDKNNEFTTGNLEDNTTYIIVFDNDDINFVEEKTKSQKPDPQKTQDITNTEQTNNDDNETTKKGGYSGKNGKYSNKK